MAAVTTDEAEIDVGAKLPRRSTGVAQFVPAAIAEAVLLPRPPSNGPTLVSTNHPISKRSAA